MDQDLVFFNLVYLLFAFFFVYPPIEVVSLGFSIPTLFSSLLGSEQLHFIHYHIVRTSLTFFLHSLLPILHYLLLGIYEPNLKLFSISANSFGSLNSCYLSFCALLPIGVATLVYFWSLNEFAQHPIAINLKKYSSTNNETTAATAVSWKSCANQINNEFRQVDKFSTGSYLFNRVYVTNNWIVRVNLYSLNLVPQQFVEVVLVKAREVKLSPDGADVQYLDLLIKPTVENENKCKQFHVYLNSLEYKDFKEKLNSTQIREVCSVQIRQSLPQQFLVKFKEQVMLINKRISLRRDDVEPCIGCMRELANTKLLKSCNGDCQPCMCRPMWCIDCLGIWFAYRQDQSQTHTWMASTATCATCRAKFCVLDVSIVDFT